MAKALGKKPAEGVCRKNEFLCANSVMLCVSVVKLPGKTFTTEAQSLHREPRRTFSDRLLKAGLQTVSKNEVERSAYIDRFMLPHLRGPGLQPRALWRRRQIKDSRRDRL